MASNKVKIKKYFDIVDSEVKALVDCQIVLDLTEYKAISEDYGDNVGISETESVFEVPGFFRVEFIEEEDSLDFFFPYKVYLNKTESSEVTSKQVKIMYSAGDTVFYAKYKTSDTDVRVLDSLFENGAKYLANKPDKLVTAIWQQLVPSSNVPMHHIELIVSQLYGEYSDKKGYYLPLRLTDKAYSKDFVLNTKQSSHMMHNTLGFLYGHSNDALRTSISKRNKKENNFFENIIGGEYEKLIEDSNKTKK